MVVNKQKVTEHKEKIFQDAIKSLEKYLDEQLVFGFTSFQTNKLHSYCHHITKKEMFNWIKKAYEDQGWKVSRDYSKIYDAHDIIVFN